MATRKKKDSSAAKPEMKDSGNNEQKEISRVVTVPSLVFKGNGWCEELQKSYYQGTYQPRNMAEYEALKKYAK